MRLLNTSTYTLTEFQNDIPPYAIVSHTWQREEVTFRDIAKLRKAKKMRGFAKIAGACKTAKQDGLEYIWIDTCCINKDSSAELSEAINSMYAWYKNAHVCYAYLWDVLSEGDHRGHKSLPSSFAMSMWFTRSWTLQELIAPRRVIFYGADWVDIGTKASLHEAISAVTGISPGVITGGVTLNDVPVAVRMSWAADRNTTREEDVAYSLMGIFDVNMPLLYGEGKKAFIRLQHEIIKKSNDHSIFAWTMDSSKRRGILARSPMEFRYSGKVERFSPPSPAYPDDTQPNNHIMNSPTPYSITNQGIHIKLPVVVVGDETLAFLNCRIPGKFDPIAITLVWSHHLQQYIRSQTTSLERTMKDSAQLFSLYIADNIADDYQTYNTSHKHSHLILSLDLKVPSNYEVSNVICSGFFQMSVLKTQKEVFVANPLGCSDLLVFNEPHKFEPFAIVAGAREAGVVCCDILMGVKPVGESEEDILAAYRTAADTHWATKTLFLDRASASLTNGWLATVSLGLPSGGHRLRGEIKIMESLGQQHPVPPLMRPSKGTAYFITLLPTPQHRFVVDADNLSGTNLVYLSWVQRLHSLILSIRDYGVEEVPFKSTTTKEKFYLVMGSARDEQLYSSIEKKSQHGRSFYDRGWPKNKAETYSAVLGNGKSVFVTQRECRDKHVADFVITLSM